MTDTLRAKSDALTGRRWIQERWSLLIAVAVTVVAGLLLPHEPERLTVTIDNQSDYVIYINATTPDDGASSLVTIVSPRSVHTAADVVDRGEDWVLHLRTLGASAGTIEVSRAQMVDAPITIPATLNDALAAAGIPSDVELREPGG